MKIRDYHADLIRRLKKPDYAIGYLNTALEDGDKNVFLLALRDVVEAWGGMSKLSRLSRIHRVSLYKILSDRGNPEVDSLVKILHGMGLKLTVEKEREFKRAA
jgi:probable addiction module antidote protein